VQGSPVPELRVVKTADFDEAVASMRSVFGDVDLRRGEFGEAELALRSARTADLVATRWALTGVGGASLDQHDLEEPVFLTGVHLGGDAAIWSRWGEIDTSRPFVYPEFVDSRVSRPDLANLAVAEGALLLRARAMTGDLCPPFRFTGTAPLNPALDEVWRSTMIHTARTLDALAGHSEIALAHVGLIDHVSLTMLRVFPNTALEAEERQRVGGAQHPTLRRALQYIDDHLDVAFTVPDLATAAHLSLRGLHAMFRRELETTPMAYVTAARLAAARSELLHEDPSTRDVAAIAMRWGFASRSHFTRRYRQAFGEPPDATLQRC
jgi:AraC-like DNA-binding protein